MKNSDDTIRKQVKRAWPNEGNTGQSSFADAWQAAQRRHATSRRHYSKFAGVAALAAAIVIALNLQSPDEESTIELADLLGSTYWSAPSDILLPDREFDIYQDMPVLFESTEPAGGALL